MDKRDEGLLRLMRACDAAVEMRRRRDAQKHPVELRQHLVERLEAALQEFIAECEREDEELARLRAQEERR